MEAWVVDSTKFRDRFLVHVGVRRRERTYIAHVVAKVGLVIGTAGLTGELLAWWGSRSIGYREFSVRLRMSALPMRIQIAMLYRIGYVRYVELLRPIVGGEVAQPTHATRTAIPQTIVIPL